MTASLSVNVGEMPLSMSMPDSKASKVEMRERTDRAAVRNLALFLLPSPPREIPRPDQCPPQAETLQDEINSARITCCAAMTRCVHLTRHACSGRVGNVGNVVVFQKANSTV